MSVCGEKHIRLFDDFLVSRSVCGLLPWVMWFLSPWMAQSLLEVIRDRLCVLFLNIFCILSEVILQNNVQIFAFFTSLLSSSLLFQVSP